MPALPRPKSRAPTNDKSVPLGLCLNTPLLTLAERHEAELAPRTATAEPIGPILTPPAPVPVITNDRPRRLELFRWQLIPHWYLRPPTSLDTSLAPVEELLLRAPYKMPLERQRCLILADGIYVTETSVAPDPTSPRVLLQRDDGQPLAIAGLWDVSQLEMATTLFSCAMITTAANAILEPYAARMPAILSEAAQAEWLSPKLSPTKSLLSLLVPCDPRGMKVVDGRASGSPPEANDAEANVSVLSRKPPP